MEAMADDKPSSTKGDGDDVDGEECPVLDEWLCCT